MRDTGQLVYLYSYEEDEDGECTTCAVIVSPAYNSVVIGRRVFGVPFEKLEPTGLGPNQSEEARR
jgi:hypothetical protein